MEIEITTLTAAIELKYAQLDKQDELKQALYQIGSLAAESGTFNWPGIIATMGGILGVGAITDNVRKRIEINKLSKKKT